MRRFVAFVGIEEGAIRTPPKNCRHALPPLHQRANATLAQVWSAVRANSSWREPGERFMSIRFRSCAHSTARDEYRRSDHRRRPGRADARRRSRPPRRALHADRAEERAAHVAEDGALQRALDGNLPPARARRENPRRRPAGVGADGRVHRHSLVEPPLLHLPYPSVDEAKRRSRQRTTARCRSSRISSSRNTRSSRC